MKKWVPILVASIFVTGLVSGCGKSSESAASIAPSSGNKNPVTITIADSQGEWINPVFDELAKQWHDKTGNTVKFQYVPNSDFSNWSRAQFLAKTEPDVLWGGIPNGSDALKNGQTIDLKKYLDANSAYTGKPWRDSFLPGVFDASTDVYGSDAIVGLPIVMVTTSLYYNKDIFKSLGLPDKAPQSWGEVMSDAAKIESSGKDIVPFSVMNSSPWNLGWMAQPFLEDLWVNSGIVDKLDIMTPDKKLNDPELMLGIKSGLIDPMNERFIAYYKFLKDFSQYFNKGYNTAGFEYEKLFNEGKAAMQLNGSWYPNQHLTGNYPVHYGIGHMPYVDRSIYAGSRNQPIKYAAGAQPNLFLTAKAQSEGKAEAVINFLQFLTDPNSGGKYFIEKTMFMPVIQNIALPEQLAPLMDSIGTVKYTTNINRIYVLTAAESKSYNEMLKVYLEDKSTPEQFAAKVKDLIAKTVDQAIKDKPDLKVDDYLSKVKK